MPLTIEVHAERFPIDGQFRISRSTKTHAEVLVCTVSDGTFKGVGECVPYTHYGETLEAVSAQVIDASAVLNTATATALGDLRAHLTSSLPTGAARNALDCALWDLEAKRLCEPVHHLMPGPPPRPVETAFTLSLDTPDRMADAARGASSRPLLKIKLGGDHDVECMHAVTANAPNSDLIIDANEAWTPDRLPALMLEAARLGVALIEQPLPANADQALATMPHPVPICADESAHFAGDLAALTDRYDYVNIKLDKAGGLTEALAMRAEARRLGFGVMIGCMVGTSLAMAPAVLLAQDADYVDLDGPLLLAKDRQPGLHYYGNTVSPPETALWG
ncbi:MAG: N-acetyl-D-Glu racemase DgcA [Pseudomonadota bacterium]